VTGIHHVIGVRVAPGKAFEALSTAKGISRWWSTKVEGGLAKGEIFKVSFDGPNVVMKVAELKKDKKIVWKGIKDDYAFTGTQVTFTLTRSRGETLIRMAHEGFKGKPDFLYAFMNTKWALFMMSLKDYLEKGRGKPFPRDQYLMHQDV
jgi:uncharacterized protein YndB with AHSA1/START domain